MIAMKNLLLQLRTALAVRVFPTPAQGTAVPTTSTLNLVPGQTAPNLATVALGPGVWADYLALLRRVSAPVATPQNNSAPADNSRKPTP